MVSEEIKNYDSVIVRLSQSKTAPGAPWWRFWQKYDDAMFFFDQQPRRCEIEGL